MLLRFIVLTFLALTLFASAAEKSLSRRESQKVLDQLWSAHLIALRSERAAEMSSNSITLDGKTLRWAERVFGEPPPAGHSLWISMHGGGGAPARVNDRQWTNQINLYKLTEGIYVAPRAPTDNWNLWHEPHIDPMFDRLIANYIALRNVDPNRIYLMGYSAGGDGVWQLAPRMADRFAGAAMMAGHPNEARLEALRNLPFALFVGEKDTAYNRNKIVAERALQLDALQTLDPAGYTHFARIYPDLPHWMNRKDAEAIPWMQKFQRNPWPKKIIWLQDDVTHTRFYWLKIPASAATPGRRINAEVIDQTIHLTGDIPPGLTLRLHDNLLNLDRPITIHINGTQKFRAKIPRTKSAIQQSLQERPDPHSAAFAEFNVQ